MYMGLMMLGGLKCTQQSHLSQFEMAIEKLKRYITGIDEIPAELIQAAGRTVYSEIHT
jgi:hypothetical protein